MEIYKPNEIDEIYKPDDVVNELNLVAKNKNKKKIKFLHIDKKKNKKKIIFIFFIIILLITIIFVGIYFGKKNTVLNNDEDNKNNTYSIIDSYTVSPSSTTNTILITTPTPISTCNFEGTNLGIGIYQNCSNKNTYSYPQEGMCSNVISYKSLEYTINNSQQLHINFYKDNACNNISKTITKSGTLKNNECINNFIDSETISIDFYCSL